MRTHNTHSTQSVRTMRTHNTHSTHTVRTHKTHLRTHVRTRTRYFPVEPFLTTNLPSYRTLVGWDIFISTIKSSMANLLSIGVKNSFPQKILQSWGF